MGKTKTKQSLTVVRNCAAAGLAAAVALAAVPTAFDFTSKYAQGEPEATVANTLNASVSRAAEAVDDFELTVNYYRKDQDYTGWNMWIWSASGKRADATGADYCDNTSSSKGQFDAQTIEFPGYAGKKWKTLTFTVTGAIPDDSGNVLGVIVRQSTSSNSWAKQTSDIMVSQDMIVDGQMTLYLSELNSKLYDTAEDAMANKIDSALFLSEKTVSISTTAKITASSKFKVKNGAGEVVGEMDGADCVGKQSVIIKLENPFDITDKYTVVDEPASFDMNVNFAGSDVRKTAYYSDEEFEEKYGYTGELGVSEKNGQYKFTVWSPVASEMTLNIYNSGEEDDEAKTTHAMTKGDKGEWTVTVPEVGGKYYTYTVVAEGRTSEVVDPYARSAGRNGKRGMIINLADTNPNGWSNHSAPSYASTAEAMTKSVIYEAHLRDLTIHESSNVSAANAGKFLGLTEKGTGDKKTPLDYLKELGITTVHFQPLFDFGSVDETFSQSTYNKDGEFNWGYDPVNYNVPEGSYSSNPADGTKRVKEMKEMVKALHEAGIQVVMDVVYNHVQSLEGSNFNKLMPGYYFRTDESGKALNGSGCGNESASDRIMFRRFMIDSVKYWQDEYKIDGFRFDLMALHDVDTMNQLYDELVKTNPDVMVYGEGWDAGSNGLDSKNRANQANASKMPNIAFFNDKIRDGVKGGVFTITDIGFVQGKKNDSAIYNGAQGAVYNFAANPTQSINYVSAHDNSALWDKLNASVAASTERSTLLAMNRMAATAVLASQGTAFFLAGEEMLRSKPTTAENTYDNRPCVYRTKSDYYFSDNSYKSPDSVNAIDWSKLSDADTAAMVEYYKGLIGIKKNFPMFHLTKKSDITDYFYTADSKLTDGVVRYAVKDPNSNSVAIVMINSTKNAVELSVPQAEYKVYVKGAQATADTENPLDTFTGESVTVDGYSAMIVVANLDGKVFKRWAKVESGEYVPEDDYGDSNLGLKLGLGIGIPAGVLVAGGAAAAAVILTKKKKGKKGEEPAGDENKTEDKPEEEKKEAPAEEEPNAEENKEE